MRRTVARIALALWAGATIYVATTRGFPSTHRWAWHLFHHEWGIAAEAATMWVNVVRKAFHLPAYALLASLMWWALPERWQRISLALSLVMAVAVADEWTQSLHPQRTGRAVDLLVDLAGALLGLWLAGAFRRRGAPAGGHDSGA